MFDRTTQYGFSLHGQPQDRDLSRAAAERYQIMSALSEGRTAPRTNRRTRRLRRPVS